MNFLDTEVTSGESPIIAIKQQQRAKSTKTLSLNGSKITLNFLPESNGQTIATTMKMLISSQYREMTRKAE
jgi:hypothetical protein